MAQRTTSTPGFQDIRQNSHLRVEVEDSVPFVVGAGPSVLARKHVPGGPVTSNPPAEQRLRVPSSTSSKQRSPSPGKKKAGSPHHAGSPHRRRRSPIPIPTKLKSAAGSPSAHAHGLSSPTKLVGSGSPARLERHLGSASVAFSLEPPEWARAFDDTALLSDDWRPHDIDADPRWSMASFGDSGVIGLAMANSGKNKMLRAHGLCGTAIYDIHNLDAAVRLTRDH